MAAGEGTGPGESSGTGAESGERIGAGISEAEHAVMEALWERSPLSAADVADEVGEARGWTLATVKTLLSRLVSKSAVTTEADGRRFLYSPAIERADYVGGESKRLVERLFGGRAAPLFAHLAETESLTDQDLAEIAALLEQLQRKGEAS